MLFPIKYKTFIGEKDEEVCLYIDPESIVDIEDPCKDGELIGVCNVWTEGGRQTPICLPMNIELVAGAIEDMYDKMNKKCPFMYIAKNLYVNAKFICAIEVPYGSPNSSSVSLAGSIIGFTIPDKPAEETAKQVNAVLESL